MSGVERLLRTDQSIVVLPEQLDADPWLLNTVSGIVDLRTGSVRPHDPQALCTKITNAPVDRAQGAGLWEAFLGDITQGDAEPKSAKVTACRMLTNANVKAEIDRRVEEYSRTAGLTVVDVLQQLKAIAFSDLRRLFDEHGRLRPRRSGPRTPLRQWPLGR